MSVRTAGATGRRAKHSALVASLLIAASVMTGCSLIPGAAGDPDKAAVTDTVARYYELLSDGDAEGAVELTNLTADAVACPQLLTNETYGTVADRPGKISDLSASIDGKDDANVRFSTVQGGETVKASLSLKLVDDKWVVDLAGVNGQVNGTIAVLQNSTPGDWTVQGECASPISADTAESGVFALPGTYDVSYVDAGNVASAKPQRTTVSDAAESNLPERRLQFDPAPTAEAIAATRSAVSALIDSCASSLLTSPDCPGGLDRRIGAGRTVVSAQLSGYPDVSIQSFDGKEWSYRTEGDDKHFAAVLDNGDQRELQISYDGAVVVDSSGTAQLTRVAPARPTS